MTGLGSQFGIIPLRGIIPDDHDLIPGFKTEGQQTKGQGFNLKVVVLPGINLPDSKVFMTHGSATVAEFFIIILQYSGPGISLFFMDLPSLVCHGLCHILTQPPLLSAVVLDITIAFSGADSRQSQIEFPNILVILQLLSRAF